MHGPVTTHRHDTITSHGRRPRSGWLQMINSQDSKRAGGPPQFLHGQDFYRTSRECPTQRVDREVVPLTNLPIALYLRQRCFPRKVPASRGERIGWSGPEDSRSSRTKRATGKTTKAPLADSMLDMASTRLTQSGTVINSAIPAAYDCEPCRRVSSNLSVARYSLCF